MSANISPPSINPTDYGSLTGIMQFVLSKFLQGVDDMLPAQVVSYNRTKNRAQVQPLVPMVTTDNIIVQRGELQSVPVQIDGGGSFMVSFPVQPGDLGYIKANDRDISLFLQSLQNAQPNTARKHSFEDAVFIPAVLAGYTIASGDAENLVIQSLSGNVKISLGAISISIEAPTVTIQSTSGNTTIDGKEFLPHVHSGVTPGGSDTGPVG